MNSVSRLWHSLLKVNAEWPSEMYKIPSKMKECCYVLVKNSKWEIPFSSKISFSSLVQPLYTYVLLVTLDCISQATYISYGFTGFLF